MKRPSFGSKERPEPPPSGATEAVMPSLRPRDGAGGHKNLWVLAFLLVMLIGGAVPFALAQTPAGAVGVYYVGPDDMVLASLKQATPYIVVVDRVELAQVIVLNNSPLERPTLQEIGRQVLNEDLGLVIFSGSLFPQDLADLRALLGVGTFGMARGEMVPQALVSGVEEDPLHDAIAWSSAPALSARTVISNPNLLLPVVVTVSGEPVVQRLRGRETFQAFVLAPWFQDESNAQWHTWPYFDYLVYRVIAEAGSASRILSFSEYPYSPIPHGTQRTGLVLMGSSVFLLALLTLFTVRRYLYLHPDQPGPLRSDAAPLPSQPLTGWDDVGFHRPLSSLLFLAAASLVFAVPLLWYQLSFLPRSLMPWTQALDSWKQVTRGLEVVWIVFDAGVGLAVVRYFAVLRLHNPREGFRYLQFYVWWQLLSGALQTGTVIALAALIAPETALAHLTFYLIACALIQFPGFLRVFVHFFQGLQRFDYAQLLEVVGVVSPIFLQTVLVLILQYWGGTQAGSDPTVLSVWGLALGSYGAEWAVFGLGAFLYWRLGYRFGPLLLPAFDSRIVGRTLGFGARLALGLLAAPVGYLVMEGVAAAPLSALIGGQDLSVMLRVALIYEVLNIGLYTSLVPALAEAYAQGAKTLVRYYLSQGMRYGMWFSLFLAVVAGVMGGPLLGTLTGTLSPAAVHWMWLLLVWGTFQWAAWSAERLLEAVGRPALRSWLLLGEQALRIGLVLLLVPRLQWVGLWLAYLVPLALRVLAGWSLAGRSVAGPHFYVWQTFVAPVGAALILYALLQGVVAIMGGLPRRELLSLLWLLLFLAFPFYGFLTALFGSWNEGGLKELHQAVAISGVAFPVLWLLERSVRLGAEISPLSGRFPVDLRELAQGEAQSLTLCRPPME